MGILCILNKNTRGFCAIYKTQGDFAFFYENTRGSFAFNPMKTWLSFVFSRNIEKVVIKSYYDDIILPRSLLSCNSLRELDIDMSCTWKTPAYNYFPYLAKLYLSEVRIMDENSTSCTLMFHFPVLKSLELNEHQWLNVMFVEIYALALISFKFRGRYEEDFNSYTIKIIGASLQNFEIESYYLENFLFTGSTVSYASLKIDNVVLDDSLVESGVQIQRLLKEFSSLKSLYLTCFLTQALARTRSGLPPSRFAKLERLVLTSGNMYAAGGTIAGTFEGLSELLHSAPVLKSLTIDRIFELGIYEDDYDADVMEPVPSCVVSHLEEFKIECYSGDMYELHLLEYFLEKGAQLKKLSICLKYLTYKDDVKEKISIFPTASTSLNVFITN